MKTLNYTLPYFHKAIKRNIPEKVYYDDLSCEFWFFTQKAIISHRSNDILSAFQLREWLKSNGVVSIEWSFVR